MSTLGNDKSNSETNYSVSTDQIIGETNNSSSISSNRSIKNQLVSANTNNGESFVESTRSSAESSSTLQTSYEKSLVSEQEDDYEIKSSRMQKSNLSSSEVGVLIQAADNNNTSSEALENNKPNEIPDEDAHEEEDDESDYEYIYSDDENCHSGFISSGNNLLSQSSTTTSVATLTSSSTAGTHKTPPSASGTTSSSAVTTTTTVQQGIKRKSTWKEPSKAAISMSLRAESEKTGSKRRLASDLYKIMMGDTQEQGFSLEPFDADSMEKWRIKLFKFDQDSNLHKDLKVLGLDHVELEMSFPDNYPFDPPFVRVVKPRFQKQTGFVMNGALCMELLTNQGWNPVNDIESVIVSIRSLIVVGDGRIDAAVDLPERKLMDYNPIQPSDDGKVVLPKPAEKKKKSSGVGSYTASEARLAYSHLSDYHAKKGWDSNGWWAKKG